MSQQYYCFIAVCDITDSSKIRQVFDGKTYTDDITTAILFPISKKPIALQEAGNHQRLNAPVDSEVKVINVVVDMPDLVQKSTVETNENVNALPSESK